MNRYAALLLLLTLSTTAYAAETRARYVVGVKSGAPRAAALAAIAGGNDGETRTRRFANLDAFAADLTAAEVSELQASGAIRYVDPVVERSISVVEPGRPFRPQTNSVRLNETQIVPWGVDSIHARQVWAATKGETINVVVGDTGIDRNHPELQARFAGGFNVLTQKEDPWDDHHHGTFVAGTIVAQDNSFGVIGVAPNVKLWAAKVLGSNGFGSDETVAAGIDWVIGKKRQLGGNWIINFSLGALFRSRVEAEAVARADAEGILIIGAAGNRSLGSVDFPAGHPGAVAISAIDENDERPSFSSYGTGLHFAGPGVGVTSTMPVGTVDVGDLDANGTLVDALVIEGSTHADISGKLIYCGLGYPQDFPSDMAGNIALVFRGELQFREKARNAKNAGAKAIIVYNDPAKDDNRPAWTFFACDTHRCPEDEGFVFPTGISLSAEQGEELRKQAGSTIRVSHRKEDYATFNGTSMSAPHVTGTAALLWSLAPEASADQIFLAMKLSARDLGTRGWDTNFGYGAVDALAAAKLLAPTKFGLPAAPLPSEPRRKSTRP
jgi:subtilisin family serine protease